MLQSGARCCILTLIQWLSACCAFTVVACDGLSGFSPQAKIVLPARLNSTRIRGAMRAPRKQEILDAQQDLVQPIHDIHRRVAHRPEDVALQVAHLDGGGVLVGLVGSGPGSDRGGCQPLRKIVVKRFGQARGRKQQSAPVSMSASSSIGVLADVGLLTRTGKSGRGKSP